MDSEVNRPVCLTWVLAGSVPRKLPWIQFPVAPGPVISMAAPKEKSWMSRPRTVTPEPVIVSAFPSGSWLPSSAITGMAA